MLKNLMKYTLFLRNFISRNLSSGNKTFVERLMYKNLCYLLFFFKIETIPRVFTVNIYFFYNTKKILPFCICFLSLGSEFIPTNWEVYVQFWRVKWCVCHSVSCFGTIWWDWSVIKEEDLWVIKSCTNNSYC